MNFAVKRQKHTWSDSCRTADLHRGARSPSRGPWQHHGLCRRVTSRRVVPCRFGVSQRAAPRLLPSPYVGPCSYVYALETQGPGGDLDSSLSLLPLVSSGRAGLAGLAATTRSATGVALGTPRANNSPLDSTDFFSTAVGNEQRRRNQDAPRAYNCAIKFSSANRRPVDVAILNLAILQNDPSMSLL